MLNNLLTVLVSQDDAKPVSFEHSEIQHFEPNLNSCLCKWLLGADHMVYPESEP